MNNKSVCIIPARGGSKRIPRKNIRLFAGKPIIAWSIQAAIKAKCFDRIIVSTDDQEIADISLGFGAEIPFLRPCELANDFTPTRAVIEHAIHNLFGNGLDSDDKICCLFATAPFVEPTDLKYGQQLLDSSIPGTVVFTATPFDFPIQRAIRINANGYSSSFDPSSVPKRSQDLEKFFHDAGQFYWAEASTWCSDMNMFDNGRPIVLPSWRVQDIDTEDDWRRIELMSKAMHQNWFQS